MALERGLIDTFANHAEHGVPIADVIERQLPLVEGRHWCISVIAGANDLLAPRCDLDALATRVDAAMDAALTRADVVLTSTCPDFFARRSARLSRLSARVDALNAHVRRREISAAGRIAVMDAHALLGDPTLWDADGLHPNPDGHAELARRALAALATLLGDAAPGR